MSQILGIFAAIVMIIDDHYLQNVTSPFWRAVYPLSYIIPASLIKMILSSDKNSRFSGMKALLQEYSGYIIIVIIMILMTEEGIHKY